MGLAAASHFIVNVAVRYIIGRTRRSELLTVVFQTSAHRGRSECIRNH